LIQQDKARVRQVFLKVTRTIALLSFPMMTGLFAVVEPFVLTFFGSKWSDMIPILQVFCLSGLIQSIGTLNGNLYLSQGRADLQFRVVLALGINTILGIVIGLRWGAFGVAVGFTIASLMNSYPSLYFAGKLVNLTYWQVWRNLLPTLSYALIMAAAVWSLGLLLPTFWPSWLRLTVQVPIGVMVYGWLIHLFRVPAYVETRELVLEQVRRRFIGTKKGPLRTQL
jgi:PST family polysaccharide transporter